MILGDVEETITSIEIDDETYEEIVKVLPGQDMFWQCHAHDCAACLNLDASLACRPRTDIKSCFCTDQQANGPVPLCKGRWSHSCIATSAVMRLVRPAQIEHGP